MSTLPALWGRGYFIPPGFSSHLDCGASRGSAHQPKDLLSSRTLVGGTTYGNEVQERIEKDERFVFPRSGRYSGAKRAVAACSVSCDRA